MTGMELEIGYTSSKGLSMKIGCPKEIKNNENRVGLTPSSVQVLVNDGHTIFVQAGCGNGISATDQDYMHAGATVLGTIEEVYGHSDLIVKVKEPQKDEYSLIEPRHTLFTYLHLAPEKTLTDTLLSSGCIAIAYETVTDDHGLLPLLTPMSKVAGSLSTQIGAHYLEKPQGGKGVLLGGVDGVGNAAVTVFGGGVVGGEAIRVALGMGAKVSLVDINDSVLKANQKRFGSALETINSTRQDIKTLIAKTDLLIGAVLVPGAAAPKVVSDEMIASMQPGSVVVDVAIDQGGCIASSKATSHDIPIFEKHGVIHYCVPNIPSLACRTANQALNAATLPFIRILAETDIDSAIQANAGLANGVNIFKGKLVNSAVADAQGRVVERL